MKKIYVAVHRPPFLVYTYVHHSHLDPGIRVHVPYGLQNIVGVVVEKPPREFSPSGVTEPNKLKAITQILDLVPIYSKNMLKFAEFMALYYMHPLGDVLRSMLPLGSITSARWIYQCSTTHQPPSLSTHEEVLDKLYPSKKKTLTRPFFHKKYLRICDELSINQPKILLRELMAEGYITLECLPRKFQNATSHHPHSTDIFSQWSSTHDPTGKASAVSQVSLQECASQLKLLTSEQKTVFSSIAKTLGGFHKPWLLHGITGSGKTELYRHLILKMLKQNPLGQALIMVPEISLTPQISGIFAHAFKDLVTVIHSAMPDNIRWQVLQAIRKGKKQILIGPRSSIFAPFANLKLIIVDEEHDSSYKQTQGFLYHSRDMAIMRAKLEDASIILGSATPSLESYHHTQTGKYHLATLDKRASGAKLPQSLLEYTRSASSKGQYVGRVSDLKSIPKQHMMISENILKALKDNFARGMQAMVVVHRRGFAHYLLDMTNKSTVSCPHCSISMSVHLELKKIICHYCDYSETLEETFKKHKNTTLVAVGYGSEKAYELIQQHIPEARCARLDSDISKKPMELPRILKDFKKKRTDILIGTQMIAKGHDFPHVTLIALLEVDEILRLADFRAGERAFQLIVQASGRSGRGRDPGKVYIQSSRPKHPVIKDGLLQDYLRFFRREIEFRSLFSYPPFSRLVLFTLSHKNLSKLETIAKAFAKEKHHMLTLAGAHNDVKILGPATPQLAMINDQQRKNLLLSSKNLKALQSFCYHFKSWLEQRKERIAVRIDVDPVQLI